MARDLTPAEILALPMPNGNDGDAATVRDYLKALLAALWQERDGFSGKHPLGNSDWDYTLYAALVNGDAVDGFVDTDGYLEGFDDIRADELIAIAIQHL